MEDYQKIYASLKKCNEVGKKLSDKSFYVLINGMMMTHPSDNRDSQYYSEYDDGFNITFIDDSIINTLGAIAYIPLLISGSEFYKMDKEYGKDFKRFEIDDDYLYLIYDGIVTEDYDQLDEFITSALGKGYSADEIKFGILNNFENNIDLYQEYLTFKKEFKPKTKSVELSLKISIIKGGINDNIITSSKRFIDRINTSNPDDLQTKELLPEAIERILTSDKPVEIKWGDYTFRVMKSLFKTSTSKSIVTIKVLPLETNPFQTYLNILEIKNKNFTTCCCYLSVKY